MSTQKKRFYHLLFAKQTHRGSGTSVPRSLNRTEGTGTRYIRRFCRNQIGPKLVSTPQSISTGNIWSTYSTRPISSAAERPSILKCLRREREMIRFREAVTIHHNRPSLCHFKSKRKSKEYKTRDAGCVIAKRTKSRGPWRSVTSTHRQYRGVLM